MRKSAAEVASLLRRAIENGDYRQHDRLPSSRELSESFGVARNTLREALYQLEKEGLIETRAGSGSYITISNANDIPSALVDITPVELVDARFALEPHICRLCVLNGRNEDLDKLSRLCDQMDQAVNHPIVFSEFDTAFHKTLAMTTRNNLLIWLIGHINTVRSTDEWGRMLSITLSRETIEKYNMQHRAVVDAIRSREPEFAASKMKAHLETARLSLTRAADA